MNHKNPTGRLGGAALRRRRRAILLVASFALGGGCDDEGAHDVPEIDVQREEFTLELGDGRRIEAWADDDLIEAERLGPADELELAARWDVALGEILLEAEGETTLVDAVFPTQPAADTEELAVWLRGYGSEPVHDAVADIAVPAPEPLALQKSGHLGYALSSARRQTFTCPPATATARARVFDINTILNSAAAVNVVLGKVGGTTVGIHDDESTSTSSPWITRAQGAGTYRATVSKTAQNPEDYIVEVQCLNGANSAIGPASVIDEFVGGTLFGMLYQPPAAADVHTFTCPVGTTKVRGRIKDEGSAASFRMTFGKAGSQAAIVTDGAATAGPSSWGTAAHGAGTYHATVTRIGATNAHYYTAELECLNAANAKTGPATVAITTNG